MPSNNMEPKNFLTSYLEDFSDLVKPNEETVEKLAEVADLLKNVHSVGKKTLIFGNGGSAAMSSHFSVDLTKNAGLRCVNCNEADLITCFSNDYGFERWVEKAVDFYGDEGDLLIVISSSGSSKNMVNAAQIAKELGMSVITFTGFKSDNPLKQEGELNFWVDSKAYNIVENTHQIWMLLICDLIIGKAEYLA